MIRLMSCLVGAVALQPSPPAVPTPAARTVRYGATVLRVEDGLDVGRAQLVRGLAEVYVHGDGAFARRTAYERVEHTARQRRLGIWRWC